MRPRELFLLSARCVVLAWGLLTVALILKYVTRTSTTGVYYLVPVLVLALVLHMLITLALWTNHRWHLGLLLRALGATVIPFGTLWFVRWARRRRELSGDWRLGRNGSYAYSWNERALARVMRRPGLALFVGGVLLALAIAAYWQLAPDLPIVGD